mgnify:CR=1 FL=1
MRRTMMTGMATVAAMALTVPALACDDTLTVGYEDWPPYEMTGAAGPEGINIRIMAQIAAMTGCELAWKKMPWKRVLWSVKTGRLDMAMTANKTPERKVYARFSTPYLPYEAVLFVRASDRTRYDGLRDFLRRGHTMTRVLSYTYGDENDALLKSDRYGGQVYRTWGVDESIRAVANGRVDGTVGNRYTMLHAARTAGIRDAIRATKTVVQREPVHFMFSRETVSEATVASINDAIVKLKADGRIQKMARSYFTRLY